MSTITLLIGLTLSLMIVLFITGVLASRYELSDSNFQQKG